MKSPVILALISVLILLGSPFLTVTFASHDAGMMVCFLLFFAVDPLYAVIGGIIAGTDIKGSWYQPILTALLFLAGTWLFFDEVETAFLGYAGVYLALGLAAMAAAALLRQKGKIQ